MQEEISILILESDDHRREALVRAFQESQGGFAVSYAETPEDLIRKGYDAKMFDICVVDFEFGESFATGFISIYAFEFPNSLCVALSSRATIENVVMAARIGAAGFISQECSPEDVVKRVVDMLFARQKQIILNGCIDDLIAQKGGEWEKLFPGKVVVVVGEEPVLIEDNGTRALVAYCKAKPSHTDWPDEPLFLEVPNLQEAPASVMPTAPAEKQEDPA